MAFGMVKVKMHMSKGQDGKKQVVFVEAGADFVDILFSFLTLPLGTVVRILRKESPPAQLGCLDSIYKSVESLPLEHFQTKACKHMLLNPMNAAAELCSKLAINIDEETKHGEQYVCRNPNCPRDLSFSSVPNAVCGCGHEMKLKRGGAAAGIGSAQDGVFVLPGVSYIVTNRLLVMPASTRNILAALKGAGVEDAESVEVQDFLYTKGKVISLLKNMLVAMTATKLGSTETETEADIPGKKDADAAVSNGVKLKLYQKKSDSSLVYAEADEGFANLAFHILAYPLGLVAKLLGGCSGFSFIKTGSGLDNLYSSVQGCTTIRSEQCRSMLLSPKLPAFFGCQGHLLKIEEHTPVETKITTCRQCFNGTKIFGCSTEQHYSHDVHQINPKSVTGERSLGGGFVKGCGMLLVTDELRIAPMSATEVVPVL